MSSARLKARALWFLTRSATKAAWHTARTDPPGVSWTRGEQFVVALLRGLLLQVRHQSGADQRAMLTSGLKALATDIQETQETLGGVACWRWTPENANAKYRLVHFHGGGYVIGEARQARTYVSDLARDLGVPAVGANYRLAPDHAFPAALEDGRAVVEAVLSQGVRPEHLVVAGDSAGGGLALATLLEMRDRGVLLAGAILGSPWLDLTMPGASVASNADRDYIHREIASVWAKMYAGEKLLDPRVSPSYARFEDCPPVHIAIGEAECLRDDLLAVAKQMLAAGVDVDVNLANDAVHCWYTQPGRLPGSTDAVDKMAVFGRRVLGR